MSVKLTRTDCLKILKEYFLTRGGRPTATEFSNEIQKLYPQIYKTTRGGTQSVWDKEVDKAYRELQACDYWNSQQGITEEEVKERGLHPDYSEV